MANLSASLLRTLPWEGGHSKDPLDPGGETYKGISRVHHPDWDGWAVLDVNEEPDHDRVFSFYLKNFWEKISGNAIGDQAVADAIFDAQVNMNRGVLFAQMSANVLQPALALTCDGLSGPTTIAAINSLKDSREELLQQICGFRVAHYTQRIQKKPSQGRYLKGWTRRALAFLDPA